MVARGLAECSECSLARSASYGVGSDRLYRPRSDARHAVQIVDRRESAGDSPVFDDATSKGRTDARQRAKFRFGRGVDIDRSDRWRRGWEAVDRWNRPQPHTHQDRQENEAEGTEAV